MFFDIPTEDLIGLADLYMGKALADNFSNPKDAKNWSRTLTDLAKRRQSGKIKPLKVNF
jgi:hypothetical protein